MMKVAVCVACLVVAVALCAPMNQQAYKPILLKEVKSLRFVYGQYALNTRDNDLIPQLDCAYNPLNDDNALPRDVICNNVGFDNTGAIKWKCEAIMGSNLEFDNLQVSCEGYSAPGDEYVKEGSCSLRYTLKITDVANEPHDNQYVHHHQHREHQHYRTQNVEAAEGWSFTTVLIFVLIGVLIYRCCCRGKKNKGTVNENCSENTETVNKFEPSAPVENSDDSSSFTKRSGFAETVSR